MRVRYKCPACLEVFGSQTTHNQFVKHTLSHPIEFMSMGLSICEFRCQQGLADVIARWTDHYQGNKCFQPDLLTDRGNICKYMGREYHQKADDAGGSHWIGTHAIEAYDSDPKIPSKDNARRLEFHTGDVYAPEVETVFCRLWRSAIDQVFARLHRSSVSSMVENLKIKRGFAFVNEDF